MKPIRKTLLIFAGMSMLSSCMISLDIFNYHEKATASDLSEEKYANLYSYAANGTDFTPNKIASNLPYRKVGDIPFIQMDHALGMFLKEDIHLLIQGNLYTYTLQNNLSYTVTVAVDADAGTITISDYDRYCSLIGGSETIGNISTLTTIDSSYVDYDENEPYVYEEGKQLVLDLASYDLDVVAYGKTVYIPFAVASETFFEPGGFCFAYNGDAFYYPYAKALYKEDKVTMSTYGKAFYGGSLHKKGKSSTYATFNYNVLCFSLDHFYGFEDKGFAPIDSYLKLHNASLRTRLKSTDESAYQDAIDTLLNDYLGDGHTGLYGYSGVFGDGKFEATSYSNRYYNLSQTYRTLSTLREQRLGESFQPVRYTSKTAFITFDSFDSAYKAFTTSNVLSYTSKDSFAFLYNAFDTIEGTGVENVVFDLSLNGGGAVDGLIASLGFLTNSVNINIYDPITEAKSRLYYSVDTNLDGKVDENDIKPYRFYVLTSNYSFSSANLFATVCKTQGIATILGQQSGGGACVVRPSCTADGLPFQMSGNTRLSIVNSVGAWSDNDAGIAPDHYLDTTHYYDDADLASYVESL